MKIFEEYDIASGIARFLGLPNGKAIYEWCSDFVIKHTDHDDKVVVSFNNGYSFLCETFETTEDGTVYMKVYQMTPQIYDLSFRIGSAKQTS